jgi:S-adenosylmethionine:tRNA ribosyltransferase-isomerase
MRTADFDFELPQERIAQVPAPRGGARLLVVDRDTGRVHHRMIRDLPGLLDARDLVVLNDTKVIPARLYASRPSGRRFELLLLRALDERRWQALLRPSARAKAGERLELGDGGAVMPEEAIGEGQWVLRCDPPLDLERLEELGEPPLPPYIDRPHGATEADREDYQTVYARTPGAVAAPTAGLHLTRELIDELAEQGIEQAFITLHVGVGTFRPVKAELVQDHRMHAEWYRVSQRAAEAINRSMAEGRRVVCVGTTTVRALEGALAAGGGSLRPGSGWTELFITPGFRFRGVGGLLTNFHLPRSSLLMLVSALAGRERILSVYREAIQRGYRFFSYGDAMLIL